MSFRRLLLPVLAVTLLLPAGTALADDAGAPVEVTAVVQEADGGLHFVTSEASSPARGRDLARRLAARSDVAAAAVEKQVHAVGTPDPLRDSQWGLTRLSAEQLWAGPATGQLVAVVDSGVDATHPDLGSVVVPGLDLLGSGDGRQDGNGHGTHVAGVVAAVAGNGLGGAGLAQGARVLPVRALDATGSGSDGDVARGIVWSVDHGATVVNLSLGGDSPSSLLDQAISYALGRGVPVVAAAGNSGDQGDPVLYPAATTGVIAVGAVDRYDLRPSWSSSGAHLSVAAPGVGIVSTVPGGGYESWSGTSMASPFVAAAVALLHAGEPALTPAGIGDRLRATARDLGVPGRDPLYGAGMVDVVAARAAGVVAAPVTTVTAPVTTVTAPVTTVTEPITTVTEPTAAPVAPVATAPVATAPVAAPPTVSVSPAVISAGQRVTVTYRGTPGAVVDVLSRTQPSTAFTRITSVVLDSTGTATSSHAPQKNTRITARSASGVLSSDAPLVAVRSVASMSVTRVGTRTYAFTGRVYPALENRLVNLYRDGVLAAQGRCDAQGIYVLRRTLAGGTYGFQVRTPNDGSNLGTVGPLRTVGVY